MFEKYKIYRHGSHYGILKRFLMFFYRRMRFTRIDELYNGAKRVSREILLFPDLEDVIREIGICQNKHELTSRTFDDNGRLVRTVHTRI